MRKIWITFHIENRHWKSEIDIFRSLESWCSSDKKNVFIEKCDFSFNFKLPFDAEVDEKFLNVIYWLWQSVKHCHLTEQVVVMILAILDQRINAINKNEIPIEFLFQGNPLILNLYFSETHINEITTDQMDYNLFSALE